MNTPFTASNGDTVETRPDRYVVVRDGHHTEWVHPATVKTLREYFQHLRDQELGRWRDPENPHMVVYRVPGRDGEDGRAVRVIDEATGTFAPLWEQDVKHSSTHETTQAAARYFAAHPEPKPWYDAQSGELWLLTIDGEQVGALAWRPAPGPTFETSAGTLRHDDPGITAGRRIWPEPEESDDDDA